MRKQHIRNVVNRASDSGLLFGRSVHSKKGITTTNTAFAVPHYRSLYLTEKYPQDPTLLTRIRNIGTNFVYKRFLHRQLPDKNYHPPAKKKNGFNFLYAGGREYKSVLNPFNSSERSPVYSS